MSASALMKAAAGDTVRLRNHLKRCREYSRAIGCDELVLLEIQAVHALETKLRGLLVKLGMAEARRRVATRRQGRAA